MKTTDSPPTLRSQVLGGCHVVPGFHSGLWTGTLSGCKEANEAVANKQIHNIAATPPHSDLMRSAR
jgi:hypothetical protein